jgi:predicted HAD superfamily phosphohydrolase YqeG
MARAHGSTVLIDLDGTLVPTGDASMAASEMVRTLLSEFGEAGVDVVIVTNRRHKLGGVAVPVVANARKPWTPRARLGSPSCVLGDQIATDGALALRLRVPFVKMPLTTDCRPWPSRQLDRMLCRLLRRGRRG